MKKSRGRIEAGQLQGEGSSEGAEEASSARSVLPSHHKKYYILEINSIKEEGTIGFLANGLEVRVEQRLEVLAVRGRLLDIINFAHASSFTLFELLLGQDVVRVVDAVSH